MSEVYEVAAPSTSGFDHMADALPIAPIVEQHSCTENETVNDRTDDFHSANIAATNDDETNHDDQGGNANDDDNDYDDCEGDDIDFQDLLHSLNNSRIKKLHSSTHLSVYDGCLEIIKTN